MRGTIGPPQNDGIEVGNNEDLAEGEGGTLAQLVGCMAGQQPPTTDSVIILGIELWSEVRMLCGQRSTDFDFLATCGDHIVEQRRRRQGKLLVDPLTEGGSPIAGVADDECAEGDDVGHRGTERGLGEEADDVAVEIGIAERFNGCRSRRWLEGGTTAGDNKRPPDFATRMGCGFDEKLDACGQQRIERTLVG
jgi:hypothetical protein